MDPTYPLTRETKNKKERIWELVSSGMHQPSQIASKVGTSVEYVYKETSRLKKAKRGGGLVIDSSIMQQAKRKDDISIVVPGQNSGKLEENNNNLARLTNITTIKRDKGYFKNYYNGNNNGNKYLDIPALNPEELKIMYTQFSDGRTPIEVIASFGYHPDTVEIEYQRFLRLRDRDPDALLKRFVDYCHTSVKSTGELKLLIDKYHTVGYLTNDEILQLLKSKFMHELSQLTFDTEMALPEGTVRLECSRCKGPVRDVIIDANSDRGKKIIQHLKNVLCDNCGYDAIIN
jgi:hypothetical protein